MCQISAHQWPVAFQHDMHRVTAYAIIHIGGLQRYPNAVISFEFRESRIKTKPRCDRHLCSKFFMASSKQTAPLQAQDPTALSTLKYEASVIHPVAEIEKSARLNEVVARRRLQAAVYGASLPMRRMMERETLSQFRRLPGLPSSHLGLELLDRRDEQIDFADFLNVEMPDLPEVEPRDQLEKEVGVFVKSEL